jgi:eukaryotic-like serine/threonine-protein kinase
MAAELLRPPPETFPAVIGRYDVLGLLGKGGMAQVLLAVQRGVFASEKLVVVKQLRPEFASDPAFLNMFLDEARITLLLNHPNVVHTYEVVAQAPEYFLAMEFLEGQTLSRVVRKAGRGGLGLDMQLWILTQVLAGLAYAHELRALDGTPLGVVHRDVTPSNVQITTTGEVKLLDFGIAKAAGAISFTTQGVIKGKLGYVAPEQCLGRPFDARADVYSVGVMLWEAIAGRRRMSAETTAAAFQARVTNTEPNIEEIVDDVPADLATICRRALEPDPEKRYTTAAEFRADLERFLRVRGSRASSSMLAAEMTRLFSDDFASQRSAIEKYVQDTHRTSTRLRAAGQAASQPSEQPTMAGPPTKQMGRATLLAAIAVSAVAAAMGTKYVTQDSAPEQAKSVNSAAVTPAPLATPQQAAASVSPERSSVRIECTTKPKRASLSFDGTPVSNPYIGRLPSDDADHVLEVSAPGYRTVRRNVRLTQDIDVFVELQPERGGGARVGAARLEPTSEPERAPAAAPATPQPPRPVAATPATPLPGQDLRAIPRKANSIDDKDPYK